MDFTSSDGFPLKKSFSIYATCLLIFQRGEEEMDLSKLGELFPKPVASSSNGQSIGQVENNCICFASNSWVLFGCIFCISLFLQFFIFATDLMSTPLSYIFNALFRDNRFLLDMV